MQSKEKVRSKSPGSRLKCSKEQGRKGGKEKSRLFSEGALKMGKIKLSKHSERKANKEHKKESSTRTGNKKCFRIKLGTTTNFAKLLEKRFKIKRNRLLVIDVLSKILGDNYYI